MDGLNISYFQFPWITLCSNEPRSQLGTLKHGKILFEVGTAQGKLLQLTKYYNAENSTKDDFLKHFLTEDGFYLNFPLDTLYDIGLSKYDFIVDCKFQGDDCLNDFTLLQDFHFLNCYTFKAPANYKRKKGPEEGISVILKGADISKQQYYNPNSKIANTKGIRAIIHEPYTIPNLVSDAFEITPGHSTNVAVTQKNMKRLNTQNSKCEANYMTKIFGNDIKRKQETCLQDCMVRHVLDMCGCITKEGTESELVKRNSDHTKYCLYINFTDINTTIENGLCEVFHNRKSNAKTEACEEKCYWNCEETVYDQFMSASLWPMESTIRSPVETDPGFMDTYIFNKPDRVFYKKYWNLLNHSYSHSGDEINAPNEASFLSVMDLFAQTILGSDEAVKKLEKISENNSFTLSINPSHLNLASIEEAEKKWIKESFYRLNIYFKSANVETYTQVLSYTPADLWSGIGGILGLWAGLSIITVVEFMELITSLLRSMLNCNEAKHNGNITNLDPQAGNKTELNSV